MEKVILITLGAAAFGYIAYLIWRNVTGKTACNCGSSGTCRDTGGKQSCCGKTNTLPK
ncbi:MAG: hypothetical protein N2491_13220 [Negativicutes bacterium]|nr:hypothetical protein [Negativicutes bacterium]